MRLRLLAPAVATAVLVTCLGSLGGVARATEGGQSLAERALAECKAGREAHEHTAREQHFTEGLMLAERAVKSTPSDPNSYFARFCNKGELARIDGESLGALIGLPGLMSDLDHTLALDPNHHDAMASKGIMLIRLPRFFGGDAKEGEAMLRRVLELDPRALSTRLVLAEQCEARGERDQATAYAQRALEIANEQGRADAASEARALLAKLGDQR